MTDTISAEPLFLGLDSSTQGLKATLLDRALTPLATAAVSYDADLPEFGTSGGAHKDEDGLTVTAPPLMWVAALDMLLERLVDEGAPLACVAAISGSGQQHGSVWLKAGARSALRGLSGSRTLREQLPDIFSRDASPIWMDTSTGEQCAALERALGGAQAVAELTGSRAYERFTGNQIARIYQREPACYAATDRIALVSSFIASLLVGDYAPIDTADGSGMNLMNIRTRDWDAGALDATAPALAARLGAPVPGHRDVGSIHSAFVERYGFNPACRVIAFSGDNPNSLAGLRLQAPGELAISLGTSDTMFGVLTDPRPSAAEGHIFANPVDPDSYMAMIVHMNGSLTREALRDRHADGSWGRYAELVDSAPVGNDGNVAFFVDDPEITPPILATGAYRFNAAGERVDVFDPAAELRAAYEGRFLSIRLHGDAVGLRPARVLATGGASVDPALLRIMADVLGVDVYRAAHADSASLGAAYRGLHGWECSRAGRFVPFGEVLEGAPPFERAMAPDRAAHEVYTALLTHYAECEKQVLEAQG